MARGKNQRRKAMRDSIAHQQEIDRLHREIEVERIKLATAERKHAEYAELVEQTASSRRDREAATSGARTSIEDRTTVLRRFTADITRLNSKIRSSWEKLYPPGTGNEGMEYMIYVISGHRVTASDGTVVSSSEGRARIDVAQGLRSTMPAPIPEAERERVRTFIERLARHIPEELRDGDKSWIYTADGANKSTPYPLALMYPAPWIDESQAYEGPTGDIGDLLGATRPAEATRFEPEVFDAPTRILTASERAAAAAAGYTTTITSWSPWLQVRGEKVQADHSGHGMYADMPVLPTPLDAANVKHWYALAALGAWGRDGKVGTGELAVATAASSLYWLPPGQTAEYLDSDPLDANDLAELRLPYGSVTVMFADPLIIDPVENRTDDDEAAERKMAWIDLGQRDLRAKHEALGGNELVNFGHFATQGKLGAAPTLDEAVRVRGAHVEGVVLLARDDGRLDDRCGWCIAVPSHAGGVVGRWVIPARRSSTVYADHINNLAAVAAWGKWHVPSDQQRRGVDIAIGDDDSTTLASGVHVLNMRATATSSRDGVVPTGRTVAAHRRRGYWRRQHYGPGRAMTKMVRIAPTLVNPREGDLLAPETVYRMPRLL